MLLNRSEKPPAPVPQEPALAVNGDEIVIQRNERRYRIRGLLKNLSPEVMKVNVLVSRGSDSGAEFHVDTLDMQTDRQRAAFIKRAAEELALNEEVIRKDIGIAYCLENLDRRKRGARRGLRHNRASAVAFAGAGTGMLPDKCGARLRTSCNAPATVSRT